MRPCQIAQSTRAQIAWATQWVQTQIRCPSTTLEHTTTRFRSATFWKIHNVRNVCQFLSLIRKTTRTRRIWHCERGDPAEILRCSRLCRLAAHSESRQLTARFVAHWQCDPLSLWEHAPGIAQGRSPLLTAALCQSARPLCGSWAPFCEDFHATTLPCQCGWRGAEVWVSVAREAWLLLLRSRVLGWTLRTSTSGSQRSPFTSRSL